MGSVGSFVTFCLASVALVVIPGPAVVYIVTRSVDQGRRAGLVSALGIATGGLVHVMAAAVGLSALLYSSATAYEVVRWAGAAYLVFLGVRRLLTRDDAALAAAASDAVAAESLGRIYGRGVVVNILNPKTALFFFAFLPQFTTADGAGRIGQVAVLGLVFVSIALASDSTYALVASHLGGMLRNSRAWGAARRWWSGTIYVVLGVVTAVTGHRPSTTS